MVNEKDIYEKDIYEVLDVNTCAIYLKYKPGTIRDLAQSGKIPCYQTQVKGKFLFIRSEVLEWVRSHPSPYMKPTREPVTEI